MDYDQNLEEKKQVNKDIKENNEKVDMVTEEEEVKIEATIKDTTNNKIEIKREIDLKGQKELKKEVTIPKESSVIKPHEPNNLVMPDRVQVRVVENDVVTAKDVNFNPMVTKIRVNTPMSGELLTDQGVVKNLQGAEVTVGQARTQVNPVVRVNQLPVRAIKIRNIVGEIRNVTAEVIRDKVIIQGIIHKQVFFVGADGVVRHFSEDLPFSTFIDIPGAEPGMNVQVQPIIEKILFRLSTDGLSVIQKIILEIFVKVTQFVQVGLELGTGPLLLLPRVVGEGTKQELVESIEILNVPALKVEEIRGELRNIEAEVIPDKVIIQGIIHKQIFFVDLENLARHQAEDVPFSLFIDIPGVVPGVDLQVHPLIEGIFFELLSPTELRQKVVIEVFVKATEDIQERVAVGQGQLFKVQQVIGEGQQQVLKESVLTLERPALKIREIIGQIKNITAQVIPDKVIIQGVIHKQIFYISTENIEFHQAEDVHFSLFIDIPGAAPGLNVKIKPVIETILFNLEDETTLRQKVILLINAVVTETVQLPLVLGEFALFKLETVIGEGFRQILVERREEIPIIPVVRNVVVEVVIPPAGIISGRQQIIVENVVELPQQAIKIKEVQGVITDLRARVLFDNAVLIDGFVNKQVFFVGIDDIVRSVEERVPFSILVNVPGITPDTPFTVAVEIENISFALSPDGRFLRQIIVINAEVTGEGVAPEPFQVVTDVTGPGITTQKVLVRAPIQTETGVEVREFFVVTDVSGPGIERVEKAVVLLDVVDDGNPNPVPIEVVTDVIFTVSPI
jgi:hypothetical protein